MLRIDSLTATYGAVMALSDVTMRIDQGEIVSLLGANGAGKTTLIRAITGLISPKTGSIAFLGEDITGRRPEKVAALGIACVPEGRHIFPGLSVEDNLLLGSISRGRCLQVNCLLTWRRSIRPFPSWRNSESVLAGSSPGGSSRCWP